MPQITQIIRNCLVSYMAARLISLICVLSLSFAFIAQYAFNLQPCVLCIWQRWPYALAGALALTLALTRPRPNRQFWLFVLIALIFSINIGLAIFHTGVEQHWWLGTSGCSIKPLSTGTIDDIRTQLLQTVTARCDEISWTILGLTMANINILLSFGLATYSALAASHLRR